MLSRLNGLAWLASTALSLSWSLGAHAAGNPADGEKKFYTCYGCHGIENYRNAYPDYSVPKLRHQHASYIIAALHEYQSGERPHATMHAQAASLSDQDIEDIAACHGETCLGVEAPLTPKPAVLAGQQVDYLEQALTSYRNGRRKNVVMDGMAKLLTSDEDVKIAAEYFSSQASPLTTATTGSK